MTDYTEDTLIEQPAIALLKSLGWQAQNCFEETFDPSGSLGRADRGEVVLLARLRPALERLNPSLPAAAIEAAIEELRRERALVSAVEANRQVYRLLKDGVQATFRGDDGIETVECVRVIDWEQPANNDFFLASQFWVAGPYHTRRPDLLGFVNGLPLVLIELKAAHKNLKDAYQNNLRDYKDTIPHLFWYNAFVLLSNGSDTRIGSLTAGWEHFGEWKKAENEAEQGVISLETTLIGLLRPDRLLDYVENFILFAEALGGLRKLTAQNHQYLGVNNAFAAIQAPETS